MKKSIFGKWIVKGDKQEEVTVYRCPHGIVRSTKKSQQNRTCKCNEKIRRK